VNDWARGYDLALLKSVRAVFLAEFKPHTHGAFGIPNERDIATALQARELVMGHGLEQGLPIDTAAIYKVLRTDSHHEDFSGAQVARLQRGDLFVKAIAGKNKRAILDALLQKHHPNSAWLEIHEENGDAVDLARALKFRRALTKITAASDIKGLYQLGEALGRLPAPLPRADVPGLKRLLAGFVPAKVRTAILAELMGGPWAQHYSSYNKRHTWTAFALKGYDRDPTFIIKPAEMSQRWKSENPARMTAACLLTEIAPRFPRTLGFITRAIRCDTQRVRFMRLASKGGELTRHAGITDPDAGTANGKVARLHIPILTAPGCEFLSWSLDGIEQRQHLGTGDLCYLDTRKPHAVVNVSDVPRIHLVVDAYANDWLRGLIAA